MTNEKAIQFAKAIEYAKILVEGHPEINSRDSERWSQWIEASLFFDDLTTIKNPAMEEKNKEGRERASG